MTETPGIRDLLADMFLRRVDATVQRLHDIADKIERDGARIRSVPTRGTVSASALASELMHTLMWGIANASGDAIVRAAAEYDHHMARGGESDD